MPEKSDFQEKTSQKVYFLFVHTIVIVGAIPRGCPYMPEP
jgi:hypothetical protein